ncbi:MAG: class I SAM-dependent methyltransferase [Ktedonobacteraceae bacterium]|nr:class I SAM-dependent methyltransferase [Ktedonobacteraceae bacterium]
MDQDTENVQKSYDQVADEYVLRIADELEHKPLDRQLLDRFAREVQGSGPVCDLGCGPGHVTRYLFDRGVSVFGADLSSHMVELARKRNPDIPFRQEDMASLDVEDESWVGIVAFYSLIHFHRPQLIPVLQEIRRVLQPGGLFLLAFHVGQEVRHLEEWWGKQVRLDTVFFEREEMEGYLRAAGFEIEESLVRPPYIGVEVETQRAYIFARKRRSESA